ncbi:hypothetical protein FCG41_03515 [Azotobacter chroococcum]|nr:hypothetical protein FCG41_03515 [Azotobacter chroococcum]
MIWIKKDCAILCFGHLWVVWMVWMVWMVWRVWRVWRVSRAAAGPRWPVRLLRRVAVNGKYEAEVRAGGCGAAGFRSGSAWRGCEGPGKAREEGARGCHAASGLLRSAWPAVSRPGRRFRAAVAFSAGGARWRWRWPRWRRCRSP